MSSSFRAFVASIAAILIMSLPAVARNVPGSSGAAQGRVDLEVGSELTALSVASATTDALYYFCDSGVRRKTEMTDKALRNESCNWGLNFRGELIHLTADPDGYDYDSTVGIVTALISHQMTDQTRLVMGPLFEKGSVDTNYNLGQTDFTGFGGTVGFVHDLNESLSLSLLGSAEWLKYDVSRTGGLYSGDYDALRLIVDAGAGGTLGDDNLWASYRTGLRYIHQDNNSYTEYTGGVPFASVAGDNSESLLLVSNLRIGRTMEVITPFLEASNNFSLLDSSSTAINQTAWNGRVGTGFALELASGLLELNSGVRFTTEGYAGYDVQLGYSLHF